jgi:hypothetical protein
MPGSDLSAHVNSTITLKIPPFSSSQSSSDLQENPFAGMSKVVGEGVTLQPDFSIQKYSSGWVVMDPGNNLSGMYSIEGAVTCKPDPSLGEDYPAGYAWARSIEATAMRSATESGAAH